jgi:phospholipase C
MTPSRRDFLKVTIGGAGALVLSNVAAGAAKPVVNIGPLSAPGAVPVQGKSPIDHIVVVMMENRSFDHFMGWMPNANGTGLAPDGHVVDPDRYGSFVYLDRS